MNKRLLNIFKYIFFLGLGAVIIWWVIKKIDIEEAVVALKNVNYWWIALSVFFSILSQISRARRWQLLIISTGHKPRFINTVLSCYVLYLVNLLIPRAGEVARCSVLSGTDKVPFPKLVGTVVIERLADFFMLVILAVFIFLWNVQDVNRFFEAHPEITEKINSLLTTQNIVILVIAGITGLSAFIYIRRKRKAQKSGKSSIMSKFMEGIDSISRLDRKWEFIGHTVFIFFMWLCMLYVVFLAFEPTLTLVKQEGFISSVRIGMVVFLMGGLAMLAPIQGGIGPYHFMIYQTLFIYGIAEQDGIIFAFIAHASTNLVYILLGAIAFVLLFFLNSGKIQLSGRKEPKPDGVVES